MIHPFRHLIEIVESAEHNTLVENSSRADYLAVRGRVEALSDSQQTALAEALTRHLHDWIEGDGMVADHARFLEPFRLISSAINHHHRKALRSLFRGTKLNEITDDLRAATEAGKHRVVTSTKPLQSWTTKASTAMQFASWQDYAVGEHGIVFQTRASALNILFTMKDVNDALWTIVDGLRDDIKNRYSSLSHSEFMDLHYNLEKFKDQNEVVALTPLDGLVLVQKVKLV